MIHLQGNTPVKLSVRVTQDAIGVLTPSFGGQGEAFITIQQSTDAAKSAVIHFMGMNQALVTFDSLGCKGITYTALNPQHNAIIAQSIENIVAHMNENMLG